MQVQVEEAERRDPKGLYKKARAGKIKDFTGISAPYEEPENAEIIIRSGETGVEEACKQVLSYLERKNLIERRLVDRDPNDQGLGEEKITANNMMD